MKSEVWFSVFQPLWDASDLVNHDASKTPSPSKLNLKAEIFCKTNETKLNIELVLANFWSLLSNSMGRDPVVWCWPCHGLSYSNGTWKYNHSNG
jgi:hypothetical protein